MLILFALFKAYHLALPSSEFKLKLFSGGIKWEHWLEMG